MKSVCLQLCLLFFKPNIKFSTHPLPITNKLVYKILVVPPTRLLTSGCQTDSPEDTPYISTLNAQGKKKRKKMAKKIPYI